MLKTRKGYLARRHTSIKRSRISFQEDIKAKRGIYTLDLRRSSFIQGAAVCRELVKPSKPKTLLKGSIHKYPFKKESEIKTKIVIHKDSKVISKDK